MERWQGQDIKLFLIKFLNQGKYMENESLENQIFKY